MKLSDAYELLDSEEEPVTITRSSAQWRGRPVGVVNGPSLILEDDAGRRIVIALDGACVAPPRQQVSPNREET